MKAEQRKQLETNVLADRMGRFMKGLKKGPSRRGMWIWIAVIAVVVIGVVFYFYRNTQSRITSDTWLKVLDNDMLRPTAGGKGAAPQEGFEISTPQGKVLAFDYAYIQLWELGIQPLLGSERDFLGRMPNMPPMVNPGRLEAVNAALKTYQDLYDKTKDDPLWGPEALYNIAVAQETMSIAEPKFMDEAKRTYKQVKDDYPKSAYAQKAENRLKVFSNTREFADVQAFYGRLRESYMAGVQHRNLMQQLQKAGAKFK
jgi:hypothetical protein